MATTNQVMLFYVSLGITLAICIQVNAQFFTKTSKSIPRMGRRSSEDSVSLSNQQHNRRALMESLLEEYGPSSLEVLKPSEDNQMLDGDEFQTFRDERQPIDWANGALSQYDETSMLFPRGSRSLTSKTSPQERQASLAMRALNINRYMQHLASGQPLLPYDKLISGGQMQSQRVATGSSGRDLANGQKYDK